MSKRKQCAKMWIKLFYLMVGIFFIGIWFLGTDALLAGPCIIIFLLGVRCQRNHIEILDLLEKDEVKNGQEN